MNAPPLPSSAPSSKPSGVTRETKELWPSEIAVSDRVGRLIEFWGFKRNMGRVWAVLYLSPEPQSAEDLREALQLSSGAVSMTLSELGRWGVVRKVWVQGDRRDFFTAEVQLWKMISRVFNEREKAEVTNAIEAFEDALAKLEQLDSDFGARRNALTLRGEVLQRLQRWDDSRAAFAEALALVTTAKIDAEPLVRFLLQRPK